MLAIFAALAVGALIYLDEKETRNRMSQIVPGLYISNWNSATDADLLRAAGIRRIICVTQKQKSPHVLEKYQRLGIEHIWFNLPDVTNAPIELILPRTYDLINESIERGEPVLVHCQAGISRSVTVVAAFLIKNKGMTATQALAKIRAVRPIANPNRGFRAALRRWEHRNHHH